MNINEIPFRGRYGCTLALIAALMLIGCSNDTWQDATNQTRGDAEFKIDYAACQPAGDAAQSDAQSNANCSG
ncbi:MAG: hypothetical protein WCD70_01500, partial [Alphaproteobacteria bacterium]